jgi:hypothetical protein
LASSCCTVVRVSGLMRVFNLKKRVARFALNKKRKPGMD